MASKSFTIDHILYGSSAGASGLVKTTSDYPTTIEHHHASFQDGRHDAATAAAAAAALAYWMGDAYYPTGSWPIPAAAIWLHQQQQQLQQQQHHSSSSPVDQSSSSSAGQQRHQTSAVAQLTAAHSSLFSSNWMPSATAAMTGCWTGSGSPELLASAYSHHGLSTPTAATGASPFYFSQHPDAAIRIAAVAAARRHLPVLQPTRKGGQIRFTHRQSHQLEETFNTTRYLTPGQRRALANRLTLTERQVKTWFQNRRAKWRRTRKGEKLNADSNTSDLMIDDEDIEDDDEIEFTSEDETKVSLHLIESQ